MTFIDFCNQNAGVITLIQTIATLFLSALAIVVSIRVARLPYKKKLEFNTGLDYDEEGNCTMALYIANTGNMAIFISHIKVMYGEEYLRYEALDARDENRFLLSQKTFYTEFPLNTVHVPERYEDRKKIKIIVEDFTGKQFVHTIGWAVG